MYDFVYCGLAISLPKNGQNHPNLSNNNNINLDAHCKYSPTDPMHAIVFISFRDEIHKINFTRKSLSMSCNEFVERVHKNIIILFSIFLCIIRKEKNTLCHQFNFNQTKTFTNSKYKSIQRTKQFSFFFPLQFPNRFFTSNFNQFSIFVPSLEESHPSPSVFILVPIDQSTTFYSGAKEKKNMNF